jgi:DNA-binding transcriptional MerR regulator
MARALHHNDRLGLLRPHRTGAGYRVYRAGNLERLEQVVALKFVVVLEESDACWTAPLAPSVRPKPRSSQVDGPTLPC